MADFAVAPLRRIARPEGGADQAVWIVKINLDRCPPCAPNRKRPDQAGHWNGSALEAWGPYRCSDGTKPARTMQRGDFLYVWVHESPEHGDGDGLIMTAVVDAVRPLEGEPPFASGERGEAIILSHCDFINPHMDYKRLRNDQRRFPECDSAVWRGLSTKPRDGWWQRLLIAQEHINDWVGHLDAVQARVTCRSAC